MKLNKSLIALAVSTVIATPFAAQADTTLTGNFGFKGVMTMAESGEEDDIVWKSSKSRITIKNTQALAGGTKVTAHLEVDFDDAANGGGSGDVDVRNSRLIANGGFGTVLMAGRTSSGQDANLNGPVDIFENGGKEFFVQGGNASNVLAYVTPAIAGGLKLVIAGVAGNGTNGEIPDALVYRAQYSSSAFSAAVGLVDPQGTDYQRIGFGAKTSLGPVGLGFSYESNVDFTAAGDKNVAGVSASVDLGNSLGLAVGYNAVLDDDSGDQTDAAAYQLLLSKGLTKNISTWVEYDGYNDEAKTALAGGSRDMLAAGMNYKF